MPHFEVELHNIIELYENSGNIHYNNEQFFILLIVIKIKVIWLNQLSNDILRLTYLLSKYKSYS